MASTAGGGRPAGNLPAETSEFVGRVHLIKDIRRRLGGSRLITLTGVGGVGKTRLALRVAGEIARAFPDGAWLVDLSDLPDTAPTAHVEQAVAETLGVADYSAQPPRTALAEHLRGRHCLLVLDNCEHLVEVVGELVTHLLLVAPELRVLATSRAALGVPGEHALPVPALSLPATTGDRVVADEGEALRLLRLRAAGVAYEIRTDDLPAAAELCRVLNGVPLAIELAAGQLGLLAVGEVLQRLLDDRLGLLVGGARHGRPGHRTLRRVLDSSHRLCTEHERLLWSRVSVFSGGFTLAAAEQVCSGGPIEPTAVLALLSRLVGQSLVVVDNRRIPTRYHLLETIRQYGLENLEPGAEAELRDRHADHFHQMAARGAADWFSPRELDWLDWGRAELSNLRAAMEHGLRAGGVDRSLWTAVHLSGLRLWFSIGWPGEGRARLEPALDPAVAVSRPARLAALAAAGWICLCQGDNETARMFLDRCDDICGGPGDTGPGDGARPSVPVELSRYAYALFAEADPRSVGGLERLLDRLRAEPVGPSATAMVELFWVLSAVYLSDRDTALRAARVHLEHAERQRAEWSVGRARWAMGLAQLRHGDRRRALTELQESLRGQHGVRDQWGTLWCVYAVAWTLAAQLPGERADRQAGDEVVAARVARLLGGAQRLRELIGVRIAGLLPFVGAIDEAERAVRSVLGDARYAEAFDRGRDPRIDRDRVLGHVVELSLDAEPARSTGAPIDGSADLAGGEPLTSREWEIAALVASGLSNPEIARKLVISARTAQTHVANILRKRGLRNRQEIAVWFSRRRVPVAPPDRGPGPGSPH